MGREIGASGFKGPLAIVRAEVLLTLVGTNEINLLPTYSEVTQLHWNMSLIFR